MANQQKKLTTYDPDPQLNLGKIQACPWTWPFSSVIDWVLLFLREVGGNKTLFHGLLQKWKFYVFDESSLKNNVVSDYFFNIKFKDLCGTIIHQKKDQKI